ncbi:MAG: DNA polymerase III subunit epsilon [Rhodospirillaceae bacterium]
MREIVLDTETTGLNPKSGDRIVEIGCVELNNHVVTGESFHAYINPERDMPKQAEAIHGLSESFLADKPLFIEIADDLIAFIGTAQIIAHNAAFDIGFMNAELDSAGCQSIALERVIDTVQIARQKFPGAQASLDALCRRFNIDLSARTKHGALLDAELLARVYLELVGGREPRLGFGAVADNKRGVISEKEPTRPNREPRFHVAKEHELADHAVFLKTKIKSPIWSQ